MPNWDLAGPSLDFKTLADLPGTIEEGRRRRATADFRDTIKGLPPGPDRGLDLKAAGRAALAAGDIGTALAISKQMHEENEGSFNRQYKRDVLDETRSMNTGNLALKAAEMQRKGAEPTLQKSYDDAGNEVTGLVGPDGSFQQVGGAKAAKTAEPKPLPHATVKDLSSAGASFADYQRLTGGFQDGFGGWKAGWMGDAANSVARNTGLGNEASAQWWQDYQAKKNVVRNDLFGSALTATEKGEFEKADVNPGMTPQAIRANLERQHAAARRAAQKLAGYYVKTGRDPAEIEAALGVPLDQLGIKIPETLRPAKAGAPVRGAPVGAGPATASNEAEAEALDRSTFGSPAPGVKDGTYRSKSTGKLFQVRGGMALPVSE